MPPEDEIGLDDIEADVHHGRGHPRRDLAPRIDPPPPPPHDKHAADPHGHPEEQLPRSTDRLHHVRGGTACDHERYDE
jgi:hypothetical protein